MTSELDKVKSTITISLGTKNRLRTLKGSNSYEQFINFLIRDYTNKSTDMINSKNVLEVQKFKRKKGVYFDGEFSFIFSYNKFVHSNVFFFDIELEKIRHNGMSSNLDEYFSFFKSFPISKLDDEYKLYFKLLENAINEEIEPLFKHNGTFVDHFKWREEFRMLNLSMKSFDEDVMEKLNKFEHGVKLYGKSK